MPREKSSVSKSGVNTEETKTLVLLLQNKILQGNEENLTLDIVKLKHPRTEIGAMFLFSSDNLLVQEIFCFSDKRSWFINDTVKEDGNFFLSTPIDPLFLVLPFLKKSMNEGKVLPLQDLLFDQNFPGTQRLLKAVSKSLHLIGEQKGPEELNAWKYVEDKTMKWLIGKTEKVAKVLKEKQINMGGCATSKNFVKSVKEDSLSDKNIYLRNAHELVSEYLTDDLSSKLFSRLGLTQETDEKLKNKRKSCVVDERATSKRVKVKEEEEEEEKLENVCKQDKPKALNAKEKAMKKAASGSKNITSFFKKT